MVRIPFSQVLKNASIDIRREYDRLYGMFFLQKFQIDANTNGNMREYCSINFFKFPFRGTCISLDDFDDFYGYNFEKNPRDFNINYLINFCEYSYNLVANTQTFNALGLFIPGNPFSFYVQQVNKVVDTIGYMANQQNGITDFVPKDQIAISVAEIVDSSLSYRVIEYNHHSMKGDLKRKKEILLALADKLEPLRNDLKGINSSFESDLFTLFNSVNIRHNNSDPDGNCYRKAIAEMTNKEIENWYDDIYQMCLIAFLELEQIERKKRVKQLKDKL